MQPLLALGSGHRSTNFRQFWSWWFWLELIIWHHEMLKNIWSTCSLVDRLLSSQINTLPSTYSTPPLSVPNRHVVSFFLSSVTKCSFIQKALMMEIWYFGEWGKNENHNVSILVSWINGFPNLSFPPEFP